MEKTIRRARATHETRIELSKRVETPCTHSVALIHEKTTRLLIRALQGGDSMPKCGLCGAEVKEQPKITAEGKCSVCGTKLATVKSFHRTGSQR